MSRTAKWEHRSDGFHVGHALERRARSAGRMVAVVAAEVEHSRCPEPGGREQTHPGGVDAHEAMLRATGACPWCGEERG